MAVDVDASAVVAAAPNGFARRADMLHQSPPDEALVSYAEVQKILRSLGPRDDALVPVWAVERALNQHLQLATASSPSHCRPPSARVINTAQICVADSHSGECGRAEPSQATGSL